MTSGAVCPNILGMRPRAILCVGIWFGVGCTQVLGLDQGYHETGASSANGGGGSGGGSSSAGSGGAGGLGGAVGAGGDTGDAGDAGHDGSTSTSSASASSASASSSTGSPGTCPGEPVSLAPGHTVTVNGNTTGASDKFTAAASTNGCFGTTRKGADLIYAVTPTASGTLTAALYSDYLDPLLHARTACPGTVANEVACQSADGSVNMFESVIKFAVTSGATYYVAADSWNSTSGVFRMTFSL